MQVFDVSSCLLFHVCILISRIGTLSTLFHGQDISFCEISVLFHAWNISDFYARGKNVRFISLAFCTHACLLISRTGVLTIFFTFRMFRSVTAYHGQNMVF